MRTGAVLDSPTVLPAGPGAVDGQQLPVLSSYAPLGSLQLHSLTQPITCRCGVCGMLDEVALVATAADRHISGIVICPGCYYDCLTRERPTTTATSPAHS